MPDGGTGTVLCCGEGEKSGFDSLGPLELVVMGGRVPRTGPVTPIPHRDRFDDAGRPIGEHFDGSAGGNPCQDLHACFEAAGDVGVPPGLVVGPVDDNGVPVLNLGAETETAAPAEAETTDECRADRGDQRSGAGVIATFNYAYYNRRDGAAARALATPTSTVTPAPELQTFIDKLPQGSNYCLRTVELSDGGVPRRPDRVDRGTRAGGLVRTRSARHRRGRRRPEPVERRAQRSGVCLGARRLPLTCKQPPTIGKDVGGCLQVRSADPARIRSSDRGSGQ